MKSATLSELKRELSLRSPEELGALLLRMAKFKKENKELLTYILFDSEDEELFVQQVKSEIDGHFQGLNISAVFYAKKTLRKALREIAKYAKFSGSKTVEVQLLIHFVRKLQESGLPINRTPILFNMQARLMLKIEKLIHSLHEDLQYDYRRELEEIGLN
ncbi:MAG: hypothetical protein MH137_09825 [Flavobacteriales bacterium]|nr:hypothetical protein [Flavobacteriales bacterium]